MSEYIKREDAIAKEEIIITNTGREVCAVRTCNLWEIHAADVEPVVRGEWRHAGGSGNWICTNCKELYYTNKYARCPSCGAHMIGAENGDK